jgi:hypothetical protein
MSQASFRWKMCSFNTSFRDIPYTMGQIRINYCSHLGVHSGQAGMNGGLLLSNLKKNQVNKFFFFFSDR